MRKMRFAAAVVTAVMMVFSVWTVRAEDQTFTRAEVEALLRSIMNGEVTVIESAEPTEPETMTTRTAYGVYGGECVNQGTCVNQGECVKDGVCPKYHEGCKTRSAYQGGYSGHHVNSGHHKSSHGHCR